MQVEPGPGPNGGQIKRVYLDKIRVDGGTQLRANISDLQENVIELSEVAEAGKPLPPVILFDDGEYLWLADGHQRYGGYKLAQKPTCMAEVVLGSQRDAIVYAAGANAEHGAKRTTADKMNVVRTLLADPEWTSRTDRWIAERCKVSHSFVGNVRTSTGFVASSNGEAAKRTGRDGKKRGPATRKPKERAEGGDEEAEAAEKAAAKANGKEVLTAKEWFKSFYASPQWKEECQIMDRIARQFPKEKNTPEFRGIQRLMSEIVKGVKEWEKEILKKEKAAK